MKARSPRSLAGASLAVREDGGLEALHHVGDDRRQRVVEDLHRADLNVDRGQARRLWKSYVDRIWIHKCWRTSSCVAKLPKTESTLKPERACRLPSPRMIDTVLSEVELETTGSVPARFSFSLSGRRRTATWIRRRR